MLMACPPPSAPTANRCSELPSESFTKVMGSSAVALQQGIQCIKTSDGLRCAHGDATVHRPRSRHQGVEKTMGHAGPTVVAAGTASGLGVHHLAEMGHLSLAQMAPLKSVYNAMGISVPALPKRRWPSIGKTSMRMEDHQFSVEMQLKIRPIFPRIGRRFEYPCWMHKVERCKIQSIQLVNTSLKSPSPPCPLISLVRYIEYSRTPAPSAVNYRLEVLPLLPKP